MISTTDTPLGTLKNEIGEALNKFSHTSGVLVGSIVTTADSHISTRQGFKDVSYMYVNLEVNFNTEGGK